MELNTEPQHELQERLAVIIERMQRIQSGIRVSGQPATMGELTELQQLGREYAHVIERLADGPAGNELA